MLQNKDGDYITVLTIETVPHYEKVYNFDVQDNENYYVTEEGILVHNGYNIKEDASKEILEIGMDTKTSSSVIDNLSGSGQNELKGIVNKVENISIHLTDSDVTGAVRDILGDPVIINGRTYDHLGEVQDALTGIGNQIEKINRGISSGTFSGDVLKEAERIRSTLSREKDRIINILNKVS